MTNAISKLHHALETWSFKYNCYEAVHPWTPFCSDCALDIGMTVFGEAIKLYTPLYLFSQLMRRKYDFGSFKITGQSILRSTSFISLNAFFALLFFCSSQYFTGKFYYYAVAYIPGFLGSAMAVLIEKPSRRSSLAFYVANVASETLFRIYVARGYVRPINNGQIYIFTLSMAILMMLAKKHGFDDDPMSEIIKLVVGSEEAELRKRGKTNKQPSTKSTDSDLMLESQYFDAVSERESCEKHKTGEGELEGVSRNQWQIFQEINMQQQSESSLVNKFRVAYNWIKFILTARHRLCPHKACSCVFYTTRATMRALAIGYAVQLGLKSTSRLALLIQDPWHILKLASDPGILKFGLFLATFSGLFKATNCWLRWSLDTSKPLNCFIAGLVAGPALMFYPSPTVALYVLWKCLEALFNEAVRTEVIRSKDLLIVILYALATSQLFYSALMDPRYMKKSYMAFLDQMSHHRLHLINRSILDVFGTEASSGYEDFFPDLHPRFMSRAFLGSVWIWMIEHKFQAKRCL